MNVKCTVNSSGTCAGEDWHEDGDRDRGSAKDRHRDSPRDKDRVSSGGRCVDEDRHIVKNRDVDR